MSRLNHSQQRIVAPLHYPSTSPQTEELKAIMQGQSDPAPPSTIWRMDGMWTGNIFPLYFCPIAITVFCLCNISASHCYALPMMINWWKKWIDFVKIKFHSNENIEWHCIQLEVNSIYSSVLNSIQFNFKILIQILLNSNLIEEKWDTNWCRRFWKSTHDYGWKSKLWKDIHSRERLSFYLGIG